MNLSALRNRAMPGPTYYMALPYRKHRIGAYSELQKLGTLCLRALAHKQGIVIVSAEFGSKQSHEIGPWTLVSCDTRY